MNKNQLEKILQEAPKLRVAVVGDYFLDQYWQIDSKLTERSLETGKAAHQVVAKWQSPGAAGTVAANLAALGVQVFAVGFCGLDGAGWELRKGLTDSGIVADHLHAREDRMTPIYTKTMHGAEHLVDRTALVEGERFDCKNHVPTPAAIERKLQGSVDGLWHTMDGFLLMDQVEEENCGVLTTAVRNHILARAKADPEKRILADSRSRISQFHNVILKPNERELRNAFGLGGSEDAVAKAQKLASDNDRPVFVTLGERGLIAADRDTVHRIRAVPISGETDIVGAGDSTSAGILTALCLTGRLDWAGQFGTMVAAITIRKIGTTGTASPNELLQQWEELCSLTSEDGRPPWVE